MSVFGFGLDAGGGAGGGWSGEIYTDTVSLGGSLPNVFATQLCGVGGYLWLGGYDSAHTTAPPAYTPYSTSALHDYQYVINMNSLVIDGASVALPPGDTLLDTGDNNFFLPPAVFSTVANAVAGSSAFQAAVLGDSGAPDGGASTFFEDGDCATTSLTKEQLDASLPPITLVFGSSPSISVTAVATESYLAPNGRGTWCASMFPLAVAADNPLVATLGSPVLASSVVIFDREHSRIGFAPHTPCP